ncbi:FAD-binding protein [Novosphingobium sp. FSY-8]|uniref:FAD-binding protein n=1 Tax=Novosphingobium ovatum TaxID=1908523 RepID=A0ABW9XBZ2_9SPHN|nr:FAD-dependent oxidoreductase [Novosphingobium ovatum]NBC36015.1 FAD-binding protein [Novosphingobium ovatum]
MEFEFTIPVLVVGGAACGCIAALAAKDAGADVLLVEADERPMGTTGMSMGLICAAGTKAQAAKGIHDSAQSLYDDIIAKTKGQTDPVIARTLADNSGPTLDWMADRLGMPWELDMGFRPSYGLSTYRMHGWHGHDGQDMVDLLHKKLQDEGIDVLLGAKLVEIHADDTGRVLGVSLARPDGAIEQVGCDTLILASGGYAANEALIAQHIPVMAHAAEAGYARNNGHEGNDGTAVVLGQKLGAGVGDMGAYQGYAMLTDPQGISVVPGVIVDGGIIVNGRGERFCDESEDIAGMVHPVMAQGGACWVILDERIAANQAYTPEMRQLAELNAAKRGADAAALAATIGVPADALTAALTEAHEARAQGRADAQGRGWTGDDTPPSGALLAYKVVGAIYHTQGGLQIDGQARVLRGDGSPLPNLFAGGGAARSVSGPAHWGYLPAMGLCTAVTLGRMAGLSAARQALSAPAPAPA